MCKRGVKGVSNASIAFIYIFGPIFAFAFISMQPIYPGEVISNDMRANGISVFQLTASCASSIILLWWGSTTLVPQLKSASSSLPALAKA
jgi:hypothetical protein